MQEMFALYVTGLPDARPRSSATPVNWRSAQSLEYVSFATARFRRFALDWVTLAASRALPIAGRRMAISKAIIETTTSNSTMVNPRDFVTLDIEVPFRGAMTAWPLFRPNRGEESIGCATRSRAREMMVCRVWRSPGRNEQPAKSLELPYPMLRMHRMRVRPDSLLLATWFHRFTSLRGSSPVTGRFSRRFL